jgi:hypothetical protein
MLVAEMPSLNLKKFFLYLLIASVALSALIGIGVILLGNFGELETKILLTTMTVTVTSILGLACGAYLETGRGKILPVAGIVFAVVSCVLWVFLVWNGTVQEDFFARLLLSLTLFAASCSHLSLLSLARLDKRFQWSNPLAHVAVLVLTAFLLYLIWVEKNFAGDWIPRVIGVLSIIIAAVTIVTPVFHRLSNTAPDAEEIDAEIERLKQRIEELEKQKAEMSENQPETESL